MQLTDTVKLIQKTALIHQGKVLLLKRPEQSISRPGAWDLPGGNAEWPTLTEPMENIHRLDAAREIREETALEIDAEMFTEENLVLFMTYFDPNPKHYAMICGWRVQLGDDFDPGSIVLSDEHTEFAWVSAEELDAYDFGEPVGTYIKTIIQNAFQKV